jgi:hypothetical protein
LNSNGNVISFSVNFATAPTAGQTLTVFDSNYPFNTIYGLVTVTPALTAGTQTFTAPADFTASDLPFQANNTSLGVYVSAGSGGAISITQGGGAVWNALGACSTYGGTIGGSLSCGGYVPPSGNGDMSLTATLGATYTSGTVTPRQPGFDSTQANNTSAEFPYNGFSLAPNNTLGAIDWTSPWTLLEHIDRLNYDRSGTLVLASKGDIGTSGPWWKLYLQMSGTVAQFCFEREFSSVYNGICTSGSSTMDMLNATNYDIIVKDNGTGSPGANCGGCTPALSMFVNGLGPNAEATQLSTVPFANSDYGFGYVSASVSGGTGYAATTPVTSTGGGANCVFIGTMNASGGVPTGISSVGGQQNSGCTSAPTLHLTAPSGTGAVLTATTSGSTMNSTSLPLLVPGAVSSGAYNGIDQADSSQNPAYIDEFAIFPSNLNETQVQGLFYQTKFQQLVIDRPLLGGVREPFIFDDDGCGDEDDMYAMQAAIKAHQLGYINLRGVIQENSGAAVFRQMLDQAGLADVPVGVVPGNTEGCTFYNPAIYNATTTTNYANYPSDLQVYRQVLAAYPSTPVLVFAAGPMQGIADFMASPADGISSLTGLQLWNRDATNGAVIFIQGGFCTATSPPNPIPCVGSNGAQGPLAANQYFITNLGTMPLWSLAGTPQQSGPGPLYTRTSKDPMFTFSTALGSDLRTGWDSLPMTAFISSYFYGGVVLKVTGGTGYANQTYFTSTGGGANCSVTGIMTASAGVPTGFTTISGEAQPIVDAYSTVLGMGHGCLTAPTIVLTAPTGTGATITAYPTAVCGADNPTSFPSTTDFTATGSNCTNQYIAPMSVLALPGATPYFQWYLNSFIDPPPNQKPLSAR